MDVTALNDLRKKLAPDYEKQGAKLTVTTFVLKAVANTLKKHAVFNASLDGGTRRAIDIPEGAVVDGDATCLSIAAASILAKVVRDRIMTRLDRVWPVYGFARHKGYGSADHMAAIREHGPCPAHRMSFAPMSTLELPLV